MKKRILTLMAIALTAAALRAQDQAPAPVNEEFDRKFRFGLRVTPQPTWLTSSDKNNLPAGSTFGIGFGLNMEFRFSDVAGFLTGIGGDFEGGRYTFRNEPGVYEVRYYMNQAGEFVAPVDIKDGTSGYLLHKRTVSTTHVTIPLILKLSTQEYSGIKYFGLFGGELGIRVKNRATDSYYQRTRVTYDSVAGNFIEPIAGQIETQEDIDIREETSLVPLRLGLNAGLGFEYRLGGSTSAFVSINFFRSFTNLMRKTSNYTFYGSDGTNKTYIKQNIKQVAIRINLGIMF